MDFCDVKNDILNKTNHKKIMRSEVIRLLEEAGAKFSKTKRFGKNVCIFRFIKSTVPITENYDSD